MKDRTTFRTGVGTVENYPGYSPKTRMLRLAAYEDTGLTPDEIAALRAELAAFKADIEAGRLVKIPATPGEMVWWIDSCGEIRRGVVVRVHLVGNEVHTAIEGKTDMFRSDKGIYRSEKAARATPEGGPQ